MYICQLSLLLWSFVLSEAALGINKLEIMIHFW